MNVPDFNVLQKTALSELQTKNFKNIIYRESIKYFITMFYL